MELPCRVCRPFRKGCAIQQTRLCPGITGSYGGDRRVEYIIPPDARKSGTHSFVAEATCNGMFGVPWNGDTIQPPDVCLHLSMAYGNPHPVCSPTDTSNSPQPISSCLICPLGIFFGTLPHFASSSPLSRETRPSKIKLSPSQTRL